MKQKGCGLHAAFVAFCSFAPWEHFGIICYSTASFLQLQKWNSKGKGMARILEFLVDVSKLCPQDGFRIFWFMVHESGSPRQLFLPSQHGALFFSKSGLTTSNAILF